MYHNASFFLNLMVGVCVCVLVCVCVGVCICAVRGDDDNHNQNYNASFFSPFFFPEPHGRCGRVPDPDGDVYEGEFRFGRREGRGKYKYSKGECYEVRLGAVAGFSFLFLQGGGWQIQGR